MRSNRRAVCAVLVVAWLGAWASAVMVGGGTAWLWVGAYGLLLVLARGGNRAEPYLLFGCTTVALIQVMSCLFLILMRGETAISMVATVASLMALGLVAARRQRVRLPIPLPALPDSNRAGSRVTTVSAASTFVAPTAAARADLRSAVSLHPVVVMAQPPESLAVSARPDRSSANSDQRPSDGVVMGQTVRAAPAGEIAADAAMTAMDGPVAGRWVENAVSSDAMAPAR